MRTIVVVGMFLKGTLFLNVCFFVNDVFPAHSTRYRGIFTM